MDHRKAKTFSVVSVCRSLPSPSDPSAGVFVFNRLEAMSKLADVRVINPIPHCPAIRPLPLWARQPFREAGGMEIRNAPMFYVPGAAKSLDGMWLEKAIGRLVESMHSQRRIDLIDAHFGYPEGVGCARVAKRLGLPLFVTIRGFEKEFVHRPTIGRQMMDALRQSHGVIAVSHSLETFALEQGVESRKIRVIHNAVNTDRFHPGDRSEARIELGLPQDVAMILSVGHVIERKRHNILIESLVRVRKVIAEARLVIIGGLNAEPNYASWLKAEVASLGLGHAVTFAGNQPPDTVAAWLRAADVFALGTAREGCCNAVLEALASGTPVVTTPAGDNAQFVRTGENGRIVPIDDTIAMSSALVDVIRRTDWDRQVIAQRLRAQVGEWPSVAEKVVDFFGETLGG